MSDMTAKEVLEKYSEGTGWDDRTHLAIACEYIDSFNVPPHSLSFDEFVKDKNERETQLEPWQREVAAGGTLMGFNDWLAMRRRISTGSKG